MQIQFHQTNRYNHLVNSRFAANTDTSVHSHRRMMESQRQARENEAVRVTISAEAMELSRQAKAMERYDTAVNRLLQLTNTNAEETQKTQASGTGEESEAAVQLTDEDLYEELLNQVKIWGDKSYALLHDYNHQETAEMAEKRAAALTEMQKLEEMHKSELGRLQRDAQKAAEQASMQQEEINKKSSELIMMIESFKDRDEEEEQSVEGEEDTKDSENSTGSLMEGEPGVVAAKGEMGFLDTVNKMDASSTQRIAASDHSIKAVETERNNIYRANAAQNFTMKEKIDEMTYYVSTLANNEDVKKSFMERIEAETDPTAKKKLQALMDHFDQMEMKNGFQDLKRDREFALQERITARDLRIAHLGDRHFVMAEKQKKELQSLFDEDDIMKTQGQEGVTKRTEDIAERLKDKLDERDHIEEDTVPDEEIREKEEQEKETLDKEQQENEALDKEQQENEAHGKEKIGK